MPGYPSDWYATRARILKRDTLCMRCQIRPAIEVDHITPISMGGDHSPDNLQGMCGPCHRYKTNSQRKRRRKWFRVRPDGIKE